MPLYPPVLGTMTLTVAASNAPAKVIARADYVCDGVADEVQINAALAASDSVELSAGTFTQAAKAAITSSHKTLKGQGNATIMTLANGANDNVLEVTGAGVIEAKVRNLRIDGNKANQTNGNGIYISTPWGSGTNDTQHTFTDIQVLNCKNNGIQVATSSDTRVLQFTRVRVRKCDGNGFYMPSPSCTDSNFNDCIVETVGDNGFFCGLLNSHFTDCKTFYCGSNGGNTHGFHITGYNNYFTQCEAQDNYQSGFYVTDTGGDATYGAQGNTFDHCIADSNGQNGGTTYAVGLQIKRASFTQIIGGIYMTRPYPGFTQRIGISLEGTTTGTTILTPWFDGNSSAGYSDTSSGTNYPMFLRGSTVASTPPNDINLGTNLLKLGNGTPYITGSGAVILINGAGNSIHFDNFAELFLNMVNPVIQTYSASTQTVNIKNDGGGGTNLQVQGVAVPTISSASTLTNKTLTSPVINTPTGIVKGDVGLGNVDNTSNATERAATATLTNKRVTRRAPAVTQSATPTINTDNTDVAHITGLAQAITSMTTNLTGTPVEGDTLRIDFTDNGTARAITWGTSFEASTVALPTTTVISTRLDVGFVWNTVTSKWRCVAVA